MREDLRLNRDPVRFWAKVDKNGRVHPVLGTRCWLWTGCLDKGGYGLFRCKTSDGRTTYFAHVWAVEQQLGPIPDELESDHLCRVSRCVNPGHIELVTHAENMARRKARQTHCTNGHPFDEANTYWRPDRPGSRLCRACMRIAETKYSAAA